MNERLLILGSDREAVDYLYKELASVATIAGVVLEKPVGRFKVLRRRIKRFGLISALGQALFVLVCVPILTRISRRRVHELKEGYGFSRKHSVPAEVVHAVASINSDETLSLIRSLAPTLVLVYGTRLIAKKTLASVSATFINIHAGRTPYFRGGNGAYWALAKGMPEYCGVTVHRIDAGIDTGPVLAQGSIAPSSKDTFVTYPLLQLAKGTELVRDLLKQRNMPEGILFEKVSDETLYAHPTPWGYLYRYLSKGIR